MRNNLIAQEATGLNRYFSALSNYGYKKYSEVYKLILLCIIEELVNNDFRGMLTGADYALLGNYLFSIYGTACLIPWPDYCSGMQNTIKNICL